MLRTRLQNVNRLVVGEGGAHTCARAGVLSMLLGWLGPAQSGHTHALFSSRAHTQIIHTCTPTRQHSQEAAGEGFLVGGKLSFADIVGYTYLSFLASEYWPGGCNGSVRPPYLLLAHTHHISGAGLCLLAPTFPLPPGVPKTVLDEFPALKAFRSRIASLPQVQAYLAKYTDGSRACLNP